MKNRNQLRIKQKSIMEILSTGRQHLTPESIKIYEKMLDEINKELNKFEREKIE